MRIAFITSTRIGDAILSTGLLGALVERYPGARITVACGPLAAPLFQAVPGLDEIIVVRKQSHNRHWLALWARLVTRPWDLAVDLRRSALPWCLWAKDRRRLPHSRPSQHRVELLASTLGLAPPPGPRLWTTASHEAAALQIVPEGVAFLVLAPTANWIGKTWPIERFVALGQTLLAETGPLKAARVLVCCGPGEEDLARPLVEALPRHATQVLFGLDLLTLGALFRRARLFVGNDSGLMHLAAAAGAPTLGLFGPTPDALYGPWGDKGAVVRTEESVAALTGGPDFNSKTCGSLMTGLAVETVFDAAQALLARTEPVS